MTPGQTDMLDPTAGKTLRDIAMELVKLHANDEWKKACIDVIFTLAVTKQQFSTDEVWCDLATTPAGTHEPRAIGPMMMEAAKHGLIKATPLYCPSCRPKCHRRPVRVWQSNVYMGGTR